ncbi:hypothetical protein EIO_1259 [Ketogulonicigenium vulgare Y25]|uniref:Uncharacterized protein n=1 Tax=Ketogulonicigenium vulgare (strain WSH-001) TaxID=759362 RepID=F9Y4P6_KETVW|nr:hypothetical protein EIO_1259 [Ketogulonicigenium vulgare Y25]AEM40603.1 hypothetical protein KVU_0764 [Ketogulonicigenium vulgare WSH-001]ALJ80778.1 hypothetical protein KVH_06055 [Ketogulonicigenium vulgare]ANW34987.1 hypothetical protein KvSKV_06025 [Ketogulonicigenium vulgare]AOZ54314.1 hypothetical protein KVC_1297 [Ketogulonicigenium vulgare]
MNVRDIRASDIIMPGTHRGFRLRFSSGGNTVSAARNCR